MSILSTLDKQEDCVPSQPLGIDYLDLYQTKSKLSTDKSTQEVSCFKKENMFTKETSNLPGEGTPILEKKKKKYRGSLLGQRINLSNGDSILNIRKNALDGESKSVSSNNHYYLRSFMTMDKDQKSKQSLNEADENETSLQRSYATYMTEEPPVPANPFVCEEEISNFFENEINNLAPWSVFKNKASTSIKSPNSKLLSKQGQPSRPKAEISSKPAPVRKSVKKLFNEHTSLLKGFSSNILKEEEETNELKTRDNVTKLQRECNQTKEKKGIFLSSQSSKSSNNDIYENEYFENNAKIDIGSAYEDRVSDEKSKKYSFSATKNPTKKTFPKLSIVCEEVDGMHIFKEKTSLIENLAINVCSLESDDGQTHQKYVDKNNELKKLSELCFTIQKHSENIDKILLELNKEKQEYNVHFNSFLREFLKFQKKYEKKTKYK